MSSEKPEIGRIFMCSLILTSEIYMFTMKEIIVIYLKETGFISYSLGQLCKMCAYIEAYYPNFLNLYTYIYLTKAW